MKSSIFAILLLSLFVSVFCSSIELTADNFDQTIKDNKFVLVMFYAPWCGHCKNLKPKYDEAAQKVEGKYVLAKVDCTVHNDICSRYEVRGYPTVIFFKNGNKKSYDGPRTTEGIISWLDVNSAPAVTTLNSEKEIKDFEAKENVVIGYFADKDSDEYKAFKVAAESSKTGTIPFGEVNDKSLFGEQKEGEVKYFRPESIGDDFVVDDDKDDDGEQLAQLIFEKSFPLVGEVGPENFKNYVALGKLLYLAWFKYDDTKDANIEIMKAVAKDYPQFVFGYIDGEKFGSNMGRMGAPKETLPAIIRLSFTENKPIVFQRDEGEFTEENVREWVQGTVTGKYKYLPKSQPVPENNDGPVIEIVGKTFDDVVLDESKDVVVEFYAPWCGHCKHLIPEYEKLGKAFSGVDSVVIGKMDYTNNDADNANYEVKGFPTILLYQKDNKQKPLAYEGTRDAKSIAAWIKENTAASVSEHVKHDEL